MPASITKQALDEAQLHVLVAAAFGPHESLTQWSELSDGSYNAAYAVTLSGDRELVLKVAPRPDLRLLTHEVDLMRTEVDVYHRAEAVGVPVPSVLYAGFDRGLIGTDYVFLSRVEGTSLQAVRDDLKEGERTAIRAQTARAATRLHRLTGPAFGYPLRGSRSWQPTWRAAFGAMVEDLLADAVRLGSQLPWPPERIGDLLRGYADLLDDVERPALIHFDLWDGNVFVAQSPSGEWHLEAFIDGERAFYGDPVAELCSLGLFREFDSATLEPFGELTDRAWRRLDLYTAYLYIIMAIEGATRGWYDEERRAFEAWLRERLDTLLTRL